MNVVFIGHVDAGKSTTGGQILYLTVRNSSCPFYPVLWQLALLHHKIGNDSKCTNKAHVKRTTEFCGAIWDTEPFVGLALVITTCPEVPPSRWRAAWLNMKHAIMHPSLPRHCVTRCKQAFQPAMSNLGECDEKIARIMASP